MNRLLRYLISPVSGPFFLPVFLSFLATYLHLRNLDFTLTDFPREMIGIATLHAVDIGKRVDVLFHSILLVSLSYLVFNGLIKWYARRFSSWMPGSDLLNGVAIFGMLLVLSAFFTEHVGWTLNLLLSVLVLVFLRSAIFRDPALLSDDYFVKLLIISGGLSFLLRDVLSLIFEVNAPFFLNEFVLLFGMVVLIIQYVIPTVAISNSRFLLFMSFMPTASFLARESAMIFVQRGITGIGPDITFFISLFIIGLLTVVLSGKKNPGVRPYAVLFFFGAMSLGYYTPSISQPTEMFEMANPVLGLERWFEYGEIPILESFNSHLLFELFFGFIYVILNGYHGLDFLVYNFLHDVVYVVVVYFFLKKWLNNWQLALATLFLYPLTTQLIPPSFAIILAITLALDFWWKSDNLRGYLVLFGSLAGLILWKIDFGYGALLAVIVMLAFFQLSGLRKINWSALIFSFLILLIPVVMVAAYALISNIPIIDNLFQALHYLTSEQTYGYAVLAGEFGNLFYAHHFLFPLLMLIILGIALYHAKVRLEKNSFQIIALLFMILFYFFNFHRGIIRHGFLENNDQWLSSFVFFVLPATLLILPLKGWAFRHRSYLFIGSSWILLLAFSFPDLKVEVFPATQLQQSFLKEPAAIRELPEKAERVTGKKAFADSAYADLEQFMAKYLKEGETFYDYSNTPMLYYYLNQPVPSYFNQMLLSMHDEFLQQCLIDTMTNGHIPFVIHSNFPETWYDNQDDVPKDVRHYHLGEFLHRNYQPFAIVGNHTVWKKNNTEAELVVEDIAYNIDTTKNGYNIRLLKNVVDNEKIWIQLQSASVPEIKLKDRYIQASYRIRNTHYFHLDSLSDPSGFSVLTDVSGQSNLIIKKCNFYPDYYSQRNRRYDLFQLPVIWANNYMEDKFDRVELQREPGTEPWIFNYPLPTQTNRSNGNFLLVEGFTTDIRYNQCELYLMADSTLEGVFSFQLNSPRKSNQYLIRVSSQAHWIDADLSEIQLRPNYYLAEIKQVYLLTPKELIP